MRRALRLSSSLNPLTPAPAVGQSSTRNTSAARDELFGAWGTPQHKLRYGPGQEGDMQFTLSDAPKWLRGSIWTMFGPNSFVAHSALSAIANQGAQIICPYRVAPGGQRGSIQHMRRKGVNSTTMVEYDPSNFDDLRLMVSRSSVVVNCINKDQLPSLLGGNWNYGWEAVYVNLPRMLARACAMEGVERFVHVSHVNADLSSDSTPLRLKAQGEQAVLEEFPNATIIRPTVVGGKGAPYFSLMAQFVAWDQKWPILKADRIVQPVSDMDLGHAILRAAMDPRHAGKTFELGGPKVYHERAIVEWVHALMAYPGTARFTRWAPMLKKLGAQINGRHTSITQLWLDELRRDTVAHPGALGWEELGMDRSNLIEVDTICADWLRVLGGRDVTETGNSASMGMGMYAPATPYTPIHKL